MTQLLKKLGPGLLFAGAAIGVSHLVQSTRAGAEYSFSLIIFIILANVIKYPFFKIGAIYPLITNNKTLIDGYKSIGKWAINILVVQSLLTMIIVIAAISMVTSSIIPHLLNIDIGINLASALLLLLVTLLLIKSNFTEIQLIENLRALYTSIEQNRPSGVKGKYFKNLFICSTMGPSIKLDLSVFSESKFI